MLRHVVLLRFDDETSPADRDAFRAALEALPDQIPEIADYRVGFDAGLADTNHEFAIVGDFASVDDYLVYRDHPAHEAFKEKFLVPFVSVRAAVQYEW